LGGKRGKEFRTYLKYCHASSKAQFGRENFKAIAQVKSKRGKGGGKSATHERKMGRGGGSGGKPRGTDYRTLLVGNCQKNRQTPPSVDRNAGSID